MTEERVEYLGKQPKINSTTLIQEESGNDLRKYRTEMPNIVDDMGLDPYSFRLYIHLRRVVGSEGKCWQNTKTLAKICNMSAGKVSDAKKILVRYNLIRVEERDHDESDIITVLNIWPQNFEHFSALKEREPVHHMNTPVHHMNTPRSPHELKKEPLYKNKPNEEEREIVPSGTPLTDDVPVKEKKHRKKKAEADSPPTSGDPPSPVEPTEWQKFVGAICWICFGHDKVASLTDAQRGSLLAEAKNIDEAGYSIEDLRKWYLDVWKKGWKWKKDESRPTPADIRSSIPTLKSNAPNGFEGKEEGNGQATGSSGFSAEEVKFYRQLKAEGRRDEAGAFIRAYNAGDRATVQEMLRHGLRGDGT